MSVFLSSGMQIAAFLCRIICHMRHILQQHIFQHFLISGKSGEPVTLADKLLRGVCF
jgi:hypothetical protein